MDKVQEYLGHAVGLMQRVADEQMGNIERAADEIVTRIKEGRLVYVLGTGGHSKMLALELFHRAGGITQISPLFPGGVGAPDNHPNSETTVGYASKVFDYYRLSRGDVLILTNVYGFNALTIDSVHECKQRGILSIGITSSILAHSIPAGIAARHPSNENLCDIADIVIDAYAPPGDAVIHFGGLEPPVAAVSTFPMTFIVNALVIKIVEKQLAAGMSPEVWWSGNIKDGGARNKPLEDKYFPRVKHL